MSEKQILFELAQIEQKQKGSNLKDSGIENRIAVLLVELTDIQFKK